MQQFPTWEKGYLGLSAPRLVNHNYTSDSQYGARERVSYYFTGGYVFNIGLETKFKPAFMVKATVITSYSIHYTKLYEPIDLMFLMAKLLSMEMLFFL